MNWIDLISRLLPIVAQVVNRPEYEVNMAQAALYIIDLIRKQTGYTTEELLARSELGLTDNEQKLLADIIAAKAKIGEGEDEPEATSDGVQPVPGASEEPPVG